MLNEFKMNENNDINSSVEKINNDNEKNDDIKSSVEKINNNDIDDTNDDELGCQIRQGDAPLIIASFACYACFIVYGASAALLGSALPEMCKVFNANEKEFGLAFTLRGTGYFAGTFASAFILEIKNFSLSKQFIVCLAVAITGLANGMLTISDTYGVAMFLFFLQGLGFGFIDTCANCVMPELWGKRVQPWMQALHSCFGIGAVIGPSLVGGLLWRNAFIVIAFLSIVPAIGLGLISQYQTHYSIIQNDDDIPTNIEKKNDVETKDIEDNNNNNNNIKDVPLSIRLALAFFYFFYVGVECGYGGWISTYVLDKNTDSTSKAAFASAIFWSALTAGRILAIVFALFMKGHTMLKIQLFLSAVACILIVIISPISYVNACIASAILGYALSSIFPLAMTLCAELGFHQSDRCTTLFVIGSCIGEGAIPAIMGVLIGEFGSDYLPYSVVFCTVIMFILYGIVVTITPYYLITIDNNIEIKEISINIEKEIS